MMLAATGGRNNKRRTFQHQRIKWLFSSMDRHVINSYDHHRMASSTKRLGFHSSNVGCLSCSRLSLLSSNSSQHRKSYRAPNIVSLTPCMNPVLFSNATGLQSTSKDLLLCSRVEFYSSSSSVVNPNAAAGIINDNDETNSHDDASEMTNIFMELSDLVNDILLFHSDLGNKSLQQAFTHEVERHTESSDSEAWMETLLPHYPIAAIGSKYENEPVMTLSSLREQDDKVQQLSVSLPHGDIPVNDNHLSITQTASNFQELSFSDQDFEVEDNVKVNDDLKPESINPVSIAESDVFMSPVRSAESNAANQIDKKTDEKALFDSTIGKLWDLNQMTGESSSRENYNMITASNTLDDGGKDDNIMKLKSGSFQVNENEMIDEDSTQLKLSKALILLRIMSQKDWEIFDEVASESDVDDDNDGDVDTTERLLKNLSTEHESLNDSDQSASDGFFESILNDVRMGRRFLSTNDYNAVLACIALSPDLSPDQMLNRMMLTYDQMISLSNIAVTGNRLEKDDLPQNDCYCRPDASTYEILLLALNRRLRSSSTAIHMISTELLGSTTKKKKMISSSLIWTPSLLESVLQICESRRYCELTKRVLNSLLPDAKDCARIILPDGVSKQAYLSLIRVMQSENEMMEGLRVLELSLKNPKRFSRDLDDVFIQALQWPTRNREGQPLDNTRILEDIHTVLANSKVYVPSFFVWRKLIISAANGAREIQSRWHIVVRALERIIRSRERFRNDATLLKHGLNACVALRNSEIAAILISRSIEQQLISHNTYPSRPPAADSHSASEGILSGAISSSWLSFSDIMKAMELCAKTNDVAGCRLILKSVYSFRTHLILSDLRRCYLLGLKIFAQAGETDRCDKLFSFMVDTGMSPGEESYSAVIQAAGVKGDLIQVKKLLEMLESGENDSVKPGKWCYEAFLDACIRNSSWNDVLKMYEKLQNDGVELSKKSDYFHMLALYESAGRLDALKFLKKILTRNHSFVEDTYFLALKIVFPEVVQSREVDYVDACRQILIRDRSMSTGVSKTHHINLIRSLQVVIQETQRRPSAILSVEEIDKKCEQAWRQVLEDLLTYDEDITHAGD